MCLKFLETREVRAWREKKKKMESFVHLNYTKQQDTR